MVDVSYDLEVLRRLATEYGALAADQPNMRPHLHTVGQLPLPSTGSAAEKALSTRPEVIDFSLDAVTMIEKELTTFTQNLKDTAAGYGRGEAENVANINKIWNDLGESGARDHTEVTPDKTPTGPVFTVVPPSGSLRPPAPSGQPSLLPNKILDLVATVSDIPTDVKDWIEVYASYCALWKPGQGVGEAEWVTTAMGEVVPITTVGDGYTQVGQAYFDLSNQFERLTWYIKTTWTGDTAMLAADYAFTLLEWMRVDIAYGFTYIGGRYQHAAEGLYRNAARAADEIAGYESVLDDLVQDLTWKVAEKGDPGHILFTTVVKIGKVAAKRLLVLNAIAQLLQVALNLIDDLYTNTPITTNLLPPSRG